jgi:hypothetical protein
MSSVLESSGDIEIFCYPSTISPTIGRSSVPFFDAVTIGDRLSLVFAPGDSTTPPYALKIFAPSGANILDSIVRSLPTGTPQSPPPIEFVVSARGVYRIEIREFKGRQSGEAKLRVA